MGLLLLLTACPSETSFCETPLIERLDDIVITPDKRIFASGDTIKITVSIPSKISDNQEAYDINASLEVNQSFRFTNISELLTGNTYMVTKGQLVNSQIILSYFQNTDSYEFECEITLNRLGDYMQFGDLETIGFIKDKDNCEFLQIQTTIKGINEDGFYEFTVQ